MNPDRKHMPNGAAAATAKIYEYPSVGYEEPKLSLIERAGLKVGVIMPSTDTPKGWNWDPRNIAPIVSILTFFVLLLGVIAGGAWYLGAQSEKLRQLEQLQLQRNGDERDRLKAESYKAGQIDAVRGHVDEEIQEAVKPAPKTKKPAAKKPEQGE